MIGHNGTVGRIEDCLIPVGKNYPYKIKIRKFRTSLVLKVMQLNRWGNDCRSGMSNIAIRLTTIKMKIMNPNKALWEKGDFTKIADTMGESGAALVAQLGISR